MGRQLRLGIALTTDPERSRERLERFCEAVEAATGLQIGTRGLYPYHQLLAALEGGELDLVWLPPLLALRSTGQGVVRPLAIPIRHGVSTYSTALFARPDSTLTDVTQLANVRAAWVDPQSAAGYHVIRALLKSRGIDLDAAFGENTFLGSHDAVVDAVLSGTADVGATFYHEPSPGPESDAPPKSAGWKDRRVRVLLVAGAIPSDMLAARAELEPEIRGKLQDSLVTGEHPSVVAAANALLGADGFVAPSGAHLEALTTILSGLEVEPAASRSVPSRRGTFRAPGKNDDGGST
jgi:phosphonate transport system substrate-binding protein